MSQNTRFVLATIAGVLVVFVLPGTSLLAAVLAIAAGFAAGLATNAALARLAPPTRA